jgi:transcriptional regulator with XRE-family HTH domain
MTTAPDNDTLYWRNVPGMDKELTTGEVLKAFRKCEGLTLKQLGQRLGISHQLISTYERGEALPSLEQASKLAVALGLAPDSLVHHVVKDQLKRAGLNWRDYLKSA